MKDTEAKTLFEEAARRLDPAAANRLRLARRAALAGGEVRRRVGWAPALAAAAVLVLGLAWWLPQRSLEPAPPVAAADPEDAAVIAEVEEDADLYAWLAEAPVASEDEAEQAL